MTCGHKPLRVRAPLPPLIQTSVGTDAGAMVTLYILLLLAAAVCFAIAAFVVNRTFRVNFLALGLLCWVLVPLIQEIRAS